MSIDSVVSLFVEGSYKGYERLIRLLIKQGVDVHVCEDGALRLASEKGHLGIVRFLLEKGADVHACDDSAFEWAKRKGHIKVKRLLKEYMEQD